ncbi:MAG TPA: FAD-dependent thymidylate synthase [Bacteroidetes bacterium]|nr:FAD-dependent thymidylate synthase [Bacteroidota bacterium]
MYGCDYFKIHYSVYYYYICSHKKIELKKEVLDKGFIEVLDKLGTDLTVVNSARVSFGKRKEKFDDNDRKLVKFLAKNKHWSPFRHLMVQFHVKAPEFVMRQWYKHVVGIETSSSSSAKDHAWNEISGRYVPVSDFYVPSNWRRQSQDNKQASEGSIDDQKIASDIFETAMSDILGSYEKLLEAGVAKEQARMILPLNQYTEVYWTASFQAIMNFIELRDEATAQWEIREYAIAMKELMHEIFPEITGIWFEVNSH